MAMNSLLYLPKPHFPPTFRTHPKAQILPSKSFSQYGILHDPKTMVGLLGAGLTLTLTLMGPASAAELPLLDPLQLSEPANALSLPTWAIHVSSVVEWWAFLSLFVYFCILFYRKILSLTFHTNCCSTNFLLLLLQGLQQWFWCGSMVRSPGSNLGKGFLGVWWVLFSSVLQIFATQFWCHIALRNRWTKTAVQYSLWC